MTSHAPPAIGRKRNDRTALLADLEYFCGEMIKRIERLAVIDEAHGAEDLGWRQALVVISTIRRVARSEQQGKR